MFNKEQTRILIDVVNKDLDITRLKILSDDDLLEQNHLIILQDVRNMLENHFNRKDIND